MSTSIVIPGSSPTLSEFSHSPNADSTTSSYAGSPSSASALSRSPTAKKQQTLLHERRPSLLSSALLKQECTIINVGSPDGPARLMAYLSSDQGFTWNPDLFLPSHIDVESPFDDYSNPVHDIIVSDEEIKSMLPQ